MSVKKLSDKYRTWVLISKAAIRANCRLFKNLIGSERKLLAVVKSNAYGHGLKLFSSFAEPYVDGFCVDSLVEGVALRKHGIKKPILVIGPTLPSLFLLASQEDIALSIATLDSLKKITAMNRPPEFHLELETGMHRRGFLPTELGEVEKILKKTEPLKIRRLTGMYTHFAAAKDRDHVGYTIRQVRVFEDMVQALKRCIPHPVLIHASATGGALLGERYRFDAVRVGIGLYGLYPSPELQRQLPSLQLRSVLSWKTTVMELKTIPQGAPVGYDLTERVRRETKIAILPVGYWHGLSRALSGRARVLIRGRSARILGRVSMDMVVVDVTDVPVRLGDEVTLVGRSGKLHLGAEELARFSHTSHYEFLTRLNPLIERALW